MRLTLGQTKRLVLLTGCLIAGILVAIGAAPGTVSAPNPPRILAPDFYLVTKAIDGDTIDVLVQGETKRVRMIGVDTPETKDPRKSVQCFGLEAAAYTKQTLEHTAVKLVADPTQDSTDMYGRLLRYVYLPSGVHFNEQLITQGYAYEYTYRIPYQHQAAFQAAEQSARSTLRGLWAPDACQKN